MDHRLRGLVEVPVAPTDVPVIVSADPPHRRGATADRPARLRHVDQLLLLVRRLDQSQPHEALLERPGHAPHLPSTLVILRRPPRIAHWPCPPRQGTRRGPAIGYAEIINPPPESAFIVACGGIRRRALLRHVPPAPDLATFSAGRGPKIAVPTRTRVAPSSTATSKSAVMPIDSARRSPPRRRASSASRRNSGRVASAEGAGGGMSIRPISSSPLVWRQATTKSSRSPAGTPCAAARSSSSTCTSARATVPASTARRPSALAPASESSECTSAPAATSRRALLRWRRPMKCQRAPGTSAALAASSWA